MAPVENNAWLVASRADSTNDRRTLIYDLHVIVFIQIRLEMVIVNRICF